MCAKPTGFIEYDRENPPKRSIDERLGDYREIEQLLPRTSLHQQAARCMDCGIPFCHAYGCPLHNVIPDFNDMVYRGHWRKALDLLHSTNNFPEFTGRICPAPCESACTLSINQEPVTIKQIELQIVERGWKSGWIRPDPAPEKSGKRVAIVGSGPAGLAAAQQLARCGHDVSVFEKDPAPGGILRYGIPDYKLEKRIVDRRLEQLQAEGVTFENSVEVGEDISIHYLQRSFDAVLLSGGARIPRDLPVPGRDLDGIHFAMPFLKQQNRRNADLAGPVGEAITATGKSVVIIGGGDTGADCLGTSLRQGASDVAQIEIMPKPPPTRDTTTPWPEWPYQLRTSTSHQEGGQRRWSVLTKEFTGDNGHVRALQCCEVEWTTDDTGRRSFSEKLGTEFELKADLVLLAMGFTNEGNAKVLNAFGLETDARGQAVRDDNCMGTVPGVFVAGDLSQGASLVVRAIADGRSAAAGIDRYLQAKTNGQQPKDTAPKVGVGVSS